MKILLFAILLLASLQGVAQKKKNYDAEAKRAESGVVKDTVQKAQMYVLQGDAAFIEKLLFMLNNPSKALVIDLEYIREEILRQLQAQIKEPKK